MAKKTQSTKRILWENNYPTLPTLDLLAIQLDSYKWFLDEGIPQVLDEINPIEDFTGKNWSLSFGKHTILKETLTPELAMEKGLTYDMPLKVEATLVNKQTGEIVQQEVFLGDIPKMTDRGTFIVNGIERVVVNQLVRSPGVFFTTTIDPTTGRSLFGSELRPLRGSWLEFAISRNNVITVRIDRRRKFFATTFLRAIGISSDEQIKEALIALGGETYSQFIEPTLKKDPTKSTSEALIEIYRKMRPGEPAILENAQEFLTNMFFNNRRYDLGRVGRYKMNKKLGTEMENIKENWTLTQDDIVQTIVYLIKLTQGEGEVDDIDHLANRRVRCVGELVASTAFRVGLLRLERMVKEKMTLLGGQGTPLVPAQLINARPVIAAINEFFRTSQLSTILDQTNPLSEIDNLRRLTVMGTGGISRERASFSIRDINASQYSRIDPVRSPEGPNIGLVTYMTLYAQINDYGFLQAPYRRIEKQEKGGKTVMKITEEIVYISADDEQKHYITHAAINVNEDGIILDERVPVRFKGEFLEADRDVLEFIDVVPRQVVGTAASMIPFLANDEANRALMGTHMQCQAVPLLKPSSPVVGTGMESAVAEVMGRVIKAPSDGKVIWSDANKVIFKGDKDKDETVYYIEKFKRSAQSTCYSQFAKVVTGQTVAKGDILVDGPASEDGELALGQNLTIAYASFDGLGYEDAIVISDRLVKEDILTSIHIEKYESSVVDTKIGPEETTRDIPNVAEEALLNLDADGVIVVGSDVGPNDILVGKIAPKGETELTAEERLLRAIFGEKAREVRDTSLRMPHGERGTVVDVQILDREKGDELEPGSIRKIIVKVAQIRHVVVGDKLAGRHGNKGVISKIVPSYDMPYLEDGTPVDIIISPLSVLARMNLGQLMEAHMGWAAQKLGFKVGVPVFEKFHEEKLIELLKEAGMPVSGKMKLYDGRSGRAYEMPVVVGIEYVMKLIHMIEDKTHARSTGPYSLVTQQPLGGKAQMGGQRLGEMEVWALEAHRAAYTLQEMLTIKADDVVGRAKAFEAIVKGIDIPTPKVPESFKVLVKELQGLGLHVTPTGAVVAKEEVDPSTTTVGQQLQATQQTMTTMTDDPVSEQEMANSASPEQNEHLQETEAESTPAEA